MTVSQALPAELEIIADAIIAGSHQRPTLLMSQESAWGLPLKIFSENQDTIITLAQCDKTAQDIVRTLVWAYELHDAPTVGRLEILVQRRIAKWLKDADPELAPYSLVNYREIRVVGDTCMTVTHYLDEYYVSIQHNHPESIEAGLEYYRKKNAGHQVYQEFIIRTYGASWFRVWYGGRLRPVRNRHEIARIRQEMANGTFYIPEDYTVPQSQIDLAYDL